MPESDHHTAFPARGWNILSALLTLAAGLTTLFLCPDRAIAAKHVFILNSYHEGYKWSDDMLHGLESILRQHDPELIVHTEYLDTKHNQDPLYLKSLPEFFQRKYASLRPDLVVAMDDSAFSFILEHGQRIFPDVPTVFCGVNAPVLPPLPTGMTGVREFADLTGTLGLMRHIQPKLRTILAVADRTDTGEAMAADLIAAAKRFPELDIQVLEDLPLLELTERIRHTEPAQGVLFLTYFRDQRGTVYQPTEAISVLSEACPVPIFGLTNFLIGHGAFGGYVTSGYEQGRSAGSICVRILSGEDVRNIPVENRAGIRLEVDIRQMKRFGITVSALPEATHFFNPVGSDKSQVLVLHSYHNGFKWTDDILTGIRDSLGTSLQDIELSVEYMDTKRFPDPEFTYLNYVLLREKYRFAIFSVILTSDDNAFNFARQHRDALFHDAPIVFCGVNFLANPQSLAREQITGVIESYDIVSTVAAAARMMPEARQLFVINDNTATGVGNRQRLDEARPLLPPHLRVEMLDNISMPRLEEKLPTLPADSIVLLMSFNRDKDGNVFSYEECGRRVVAASPVPVFSFWDFYLGCGTVGGMVTSGVHQGLAAGQLARSILDGKKAGDLPIIVQSPNKLIFDAKALDRYGINRSRLPAESLLINDDRAESLRPAVIWIIVMLVCSLILATAVLAFLFRRQQKKRRALEKSVRIDPLTGACSRGAFEQEVPQALQSAREKIILCYVDIDKLKRVNDTYGHMHGDVYLKDTVAVLRSCIRTTDEIYRIGGDEFILIFPGCSKADVRRIWDLVHERIQSVNASGVHPFTMGLTYGCAEFDPQAPQDLPTLLRVADRDMYAQKSGRTI